MSGKFMVQVAPELVDIADERAKALLKTRTAVINEWILLGRLAQEAGATLATQRATDSVKRVTDSNSKVKTETLVIKYVGNKGSTPAPESQDEFEAAVARALRENGDLAEVIAQRVRENVARTLQDLNSNNAPVVGSAEWDKLSEQPKQRKGADKVDLGNSDAVSQHTLNGLPANAQVRQ